jgi:putative DNA primase/helicase
VAYDPQAACPTWERFLWRIIGGTNLEDDTEDRGAGESDNRQAADDRAKRLIGFLQRAIGYSLTGETREQCLFVLHGSGANGKSTFLEVLQTLLGDYAQSTPSASLLAKDRHDGIPNDIARLRGARLVTAVEIGQGRRLNEELMKRLTGQDTITARFLHAEFFDFRAEFKLFIACNHLPTITGTDHAIWRRIRLIPFTVTIPETEQDKDLPAKLQAELPGILAWAVRGCLAWQREGLGTPEEVKQATAGYRASMDQIGRFIEECCLVSQQVRIKASELYEAYKKWCDANGEQAATLSAFGHYLEEQGFAKHKIGTIWRLGIGLHAIPDD